LAQDVCGSVSWVDQPDRCDVNANHRTVSAVDEVSLRITLVPERAATLPWIDGTGPHIGCKFDAFRTRGQRSEVSLRGRKWGYTSAGLSHSVTTYAHARLLP
jgi:hypothetical protein